MTTDDRFAEIRAHNQRVSVLSFCAWMTTIGFTVGVFLDFNDPFSTTGTIPIVVAAGANVISFVVYLVRKGRAARRSTQKAANS